MLNINADNFSNTLSPNYQVADLFNFVKERLIACGMQIKENLSTNELGCFLTLSDKLKGKIKLIYKVALNRIDIALYADENYDLDNWKELKVNSGAKTYTTISNLNPLTIYSIPTNNKIFGLVLLESGNIFKGMLGIAYANADNWYSENDYVLAGLLTPNTPNNFTIPLPNPQNSMMICRFKIETFSTRNPNNVAQILTAPYCTFANYGIGARFDESVGLSNNQGFSTNDLSIKDDTKYWNLYCADNGVVLKVS